MTDYPDVQPFSLSAITRPEEVAIVIKAMLRVAELWGLTDTEGAALFDVSHATWSKMARGTFSGFLSQTQATRASLTLSIFKALRETFHGSLALRWPCLSNDGSPFFGRRPIDFMIGGGTPAFSEVRKHIRAPFA